MKRLSQKSNQSLASRDRAAGAVTAIFCGLWPLFIGLFELIRGYETASLSHVFSLKD